jgi:hypothetical protein
VTADQAALAQAAPKAALVAIHAPARDVEYVTPIWNDKISLTSILEVKPNPVSLVYVDYQK